ncbi:MAG: hypothetical protein M3168_04170 [Actinomycetota bacterium]|nr:hypothetical protein [Actinomycetota bacterium]
MSEGVKREAIDEFVARALRLTDGDRSVLAAARAEVSEAYHEKALWAAAEALVGRGEEYAHARALVARAHVPEGVEDESDAVARLVRLAIDEGLVAVVGADLLHPNHLRELYRPWRALDSARDS